MSEISMIERVAKALEVVIWEYKDSSVDFQSHQLARAALEAMRTPTEVMTNEWPHAHAHLIEGHWRRAIDVALSEKP